MANGITEEVVKNIYEGCTPEGHKPKEFCVCCPIVEYQRGGGVRIIHFPISQHTLKK